MASTTGPGTSLLWTSRGHNMKTVGCGLDKEKSINTVCFYLLRLKFSPDSASGRRTRSHLTEGIFASGAASKAGSSSSSSQSCSTKAVPFSTRKLAACRSPSPNHSTSEWFLPPATKAVPAPARRRKQFPQTHHGYQHPCDSAGYHPGAGTSTALLRIC